MKMTPATVHGAENRNGIPQNSNKSENNGESHFCKLVLLCGLGFFITVLTTHKRGTTKWNGNPIQEKPPRA